MQQTKVASNQTALETFLKFVAYIAHLGTGNTRRNIARFMSSNVASVELRLYLLSYAQERQIEYVSVGKGHRSLNNSVLPVVVEQDR